MSYWLRSLRFLASALSSANSPRQLALGFSMGMMIGLVPKENLTAVILLFILAGSKVNLCSASLGTIVFSWLAILIDPLSHLIGRSVLLASSLQGFWVSVYEVPLAPWTDFNNTIVMGSLILGLFMFYPVFRISKPQFEKYTPLLTHKLKKYRIVQLLWGTQVGAIVGEVS
ncbi:MAG: TIGR03546 family protein [Planctomycetes bacterium]|nr:TIGR03546 family protein [Planctomycetota bacterium]MCH9726532.1 TIGR03546 family protein [Planctomycetota bacterium]MCH9779201.1 TIGR03546 family protein [Planctomycetota bacterium]MCH9792252.1 TIGR03546 family protein [Planctomycetota bacterium]MDF1744303.1 TIGR03546 family protein [Gimesia sp.]